MKTALMRNAPNLNLPGTRDPIVHRSQALAAARKLCVQAGLQTGAGA